MKNQFWFEGMRSVTFQFPRNVQSAVVNYTYIDENGEKKTGTKKVEFEKEAGNVQ